MKTIRLKISKVEDQDFINLIYTHQGLVQIVISRVSICFQLNIEIDQIMGQTMEMYETP